MNGLSSCYFSYPGWVHQDRLLTMQGVHLSVGVYAKEFVAFMRKKSLPINERSFSFWVESLVADYFKLSLDQCRAKNRKKEIVTARQVMMALLRRHTHQSLTKIGDRYGKDHATVLHAVRTVKNRSEVYKNYRANFYYLDTTVALAKEWFDSALKNNFTLKDFENVTNV